MKNKRLQFTVGLLFFCVMGLAQVQTDVTAEATSNSNATIGQVLPDGYFCVEFSTPVKLYSVQIINKPGKIVGTYFSSNQKQCISVNHLKPGLYTVEVKSKAYSTRKKILID